MRRTIHLNADAAANAKILLGVAMTVLEAEILAGSSDAVVCSLGNRVLETSAVDPDAFLTLASFGDGTTGQNQRSHLGNLKISLKSDDIFFLNNSTNSEVCRANIVVDIGSS